MNEMLDRKQKRPAAVNYSLPRFLRGHTTSFRCTQYATTISARCQEEKSPRLRKPQAKRPAVNGHRASLAHGRAASKSERRNTIKFRKLESRPHTIGFMSGRRSRNPEPCRAASVMPAGRWPASTPSVMPEGRYRASTPSVMPEGRYRASIPPVTPEGRYRASRNVPVWIPSLRLHAGMTMTRLRSARSQSIHGATTLR
jgi:hypothetical protein